MPDTRFTFFLPAYNGGDYLKTCVQSIRAQTVDDWNLAVLDDGSTDETQKWLEELRDTRIALYPSAHLGIEGNWARIKDSPRAKFMTIAGQDDVFDPTYLETIRALVAARPDAALYQTQFRLIDARGRTIRDAATQPTRETASEFLASRLQNRRDSFGTGYVMRSSDYDVVGGIPLFPKLLFADDALWISLMRRGYKATASETRFSYRVHVRSTSAAAHWRTHVAAMTQWVTFLQNVCREDAALARVYDADGSNFFLNFCRHLYLLALVEATQRHQRIGNDVLPTLAAALSRIDPSLVADIPRRRDLRFRFFLNQNPAARFAYNAFVLARYGQWRGRKLQRK